MTAELVSTFVDCSARRLQMHLSRIEKCVAKLSEEQVWARGSENENAIGNLMLHLAGNVRQWIGSAVGGKPDIRMRDREFATRAGVTKQDMFERLQGVVNEAVTIIEGLTSERLAQRVKVQNYDVPVLEAVYHVVDHFAQHTAQIIFAAKMMTHEDMGFYRHLANPSHGQTTP